MQKHIVRSTLKIKLPSFNKGENYGWFKAENVNQERGVVPERIPEGPLQPHLTVFG